MKRPHDDWVERIAEPTLRQTLAQLQFVAECLNEEDPMQADTKFHVSKAVEQVAKALAEVTP